MSFHTGNKNIKPPEGRNTTKSQKKTASDDDLSQGQCVRREQWDITDAENRSSDNKKYIRSDTR